MSGLSANARKQQAGRALSSAKKAAFAKRMRALKKNGSARRSSSISAKKFRVKRRLPGYSANSMSAAERTRRSKAFEYAKTHRSPRKPVPKYEHAGFDAKRFAERRAKAKKKSRRTKAASTATRKAIMARKTRRKKSAARKPVARRAKRRVKRRKSAKRSSVAPKRRKRRKARKSVAKAPKRTRRRRKAKALKANPRRRRRLRRNSGTSAGARKGWRTRKARRAAPKRRRRVSRKRRSGKRRKLSMKKSAVAARRRRRAAARGGAPIRRRRRSRRKLTANRKRRSRRTRRAAPRRRSRRMASNRRSRRSHRRVSHRRHRRNGRRRMFRKNGVMEPILFVLKTGGLALGGFLAHKVITNALMNYGFNHIFGAPAAVVVPATPTTPPVVAPATAGLGLITLDPAYQKLIAGGLVAALGVFAASKLIKDSTTRNTVATGIAVSFTTTLLAAALTKFAPQYAGLLAGPDDGTAARLSAMYGFGGTSIQPRYAAIGGRGMGEYFQSGVSGLGEYFQSGVSGLGEYFQSGVSGLGALPSYEANAGYGANPDLMEAAAGMGARETMSTNHVDPHGDLDRELTIAEAAAGVGAYEAAAGYGSISTVPSSSTWIPGMSNGQLWAGTRSISNGQSATEMVPAGILQTDGGQGVFG
jgi:hypothetical protein